MSEKQKSPLNPADFTANVDPIYTADNDDDDRLMGSVYIPESPPPRSLMGCPPLTEPPSPPPLAGIPAPPPPAPPKRSSVTRLLIPILISVALIALTFALMYGYSRL